MHPIPQRITLPGFLMLSFTLTACSPDSALSPGSGAGTKMTAVVAPPSKAAVVSNDNGWETWPLFWQNACTGATLTGSFSIHLQSQTKTNVDGTVRRDIQHITIRPVQIDGYVITRTGGYHQVFYNADASYTATATEFWNVVSKGSLANERVVMTLVITGIGSDPPTVEFNWSSVCSG